MTHSPRANSQWFRVKLGHTTAIVAATSSQEAVSKARDALSLDMPRLWDVIHNLQESQFDVVEITEEPERKSA